MENATPRIYSNVVTRLQAVRRKQNIASVVFGVFASIAAIVAAFLIAAILESALYLGTGWRTALFWIVAALTLALIGWLVVRPLLRLFGVLSDETDSVTAATVGRKFPSINDHLVNILQLYSEREQSKRYSVELIDASFEDVRKEIDPIDFTAVVDYSPARRHSKILGAVLTIGVLLFVLLPTAFFGSVDRLWHYSESFAAPLPFRLFVEPGNVEVVKGESVSVTVGVEGKPQSEVTISTKPEGQVTYEDRVLTPNDKGEFAYEVQSLKLSTKYYVHSGSVETEEYTITVIDRPIVKKLQVELAFPRYAHLPSKQLDDNVGDVSALKGTSVHFSVEANKELTAATLVFSDSARTTLSITDKKASGSITLLKDRSYHIILTDKDSVANAEPIEYAMKIIPDAYPTASVLFPGTNIDIAENAKLNMLFRIKDDYGFTSLRLAYRLIQSRYERPAEEYTFVRVPVPEGVKTEGDIAYPWNLASLSLVPEDVLSYYIEVFDNDNVSGPKSGRSDVYTLRLPSLEEVFADVDRSHDVSLDAMKEAFKQAEEAKRELNELQQDLKKNQQKMDWQEQKKAEELVKKYDEIRKKMEEVNKTIDQMVDKMEKNQVLSKETLEKYQELQQLMEQMNSPDFAEAMKKMQQAMQQLSPEAMKQALEQFNFSEENFRKSIERTMNLLKRIQIEQKVEEAMKRAEEMMKQQEELQKQTEQTNPSDKNKLNELAQQQKDLKEQLEQMQKELEDLQKKMEEFPSEMPLKEMEAAKNQLEQSRLQEQMEQIAQQMQQQQMQQAMQNQQQAMQKMGQFMQSMQQMQQAMQENQQRQIVNEMRKALQDLLELSKRQEALKNESQSLEPNSQQFRENAQQQMQVMRDLANVTNGLSKLSQKTFGVTPEMGKSIGDAMRQMDQAMQSLEQRNGTNAGQQQAGAMGSLNEAAQQMQGALNGMMQGGGQGMGMAGFMQRLQSMTGMQQGINQGTQNLGGMSQQQAAELGRLAAEQGAVRKSLEQLTKEAAQTGELSKMLGDLNRVAQDMREVQTDLAQGNVNPETLRKQDRILSRLLDSQRSVRERDFEKRRRAESGTNVARRSPGEIDLSTQEGRTKFQQDLLKAMEEGYSRDYQDLIRKYFEALEQSQKEH